MVYISLSNGIVLMYIHSSHWKHCLCIAKVQKYHTGTSGLKLVPAITFLGSKFGDPPKFAEKQIMTWNFRLKSLPSNSVKPIRSRMMEGGRNSNRIESAMPEIQCTILVEDHKQLSGLPQSKV